MEILHEHHRLPRFLAVVFYRPVSRPNLVSMPTSLHEKGRDGFRGVFVLELCKRDGVVGRDMGVPGQPGGAGTWSADSRTRRSGQSITDPCHLVLSYPPKLPSQREPGRDRAEP